MKTSTSIFRIFKSSWGIWVKIQGQSEEIEGEVNELEIAISNIKLSENELQYLREGYKWIESKIKEKEKKAIKITINSLELVLTDYQKEGLFYAIAFWISEHFNFEMPKFQCKFVKESNRYEFPDLDKK